jgi:hypothetical protein
MTTTFKTLAEFKAANKAAGNHFFDRKTMNFFNSRIESGLIGGMFFITSESDMRNTERFYNVRRIDNGGVSVNTVAKFNTIKYKDTAKRLISRLLKDYPVIAKGDDITALSTIAHIILA